jgi:hypothetical protein
MDGRTPWMGARRHYETVPKSRAYWILENGGGHNPFWSLISRVGQRVPATFAGAEQTFINVLLSFLNWGSLPAQGWADLKTGDDFFVEEKSN